MCVITTATITTATIMIVTITTATITTAVVMTAATKPRCALPRYLIVNGRGLQLGCQRRLLLPQLHELHISGHHRLQRGALIADNLLWWRWALMGGTWQHSQHSIGTSTVQHHIGCHGCCGCYYQLCSAQTCSTNSTSRFSGTGICRRAIIRSRVDLPLPLGPTRP